MVTINKKLHAATPGSGDVMIGGECDVGTILYQGYTPSLSEKGSGVYINHRDAFLVQHS